MLKFFSLLPRVQKVQPVYQVNEVNVEFEVNKGQLVYEAKTVAKVTMVFQVKMVPLVLIFQVQLAHQVFQALNG